MLFKTRGRFSVISHLRAFRPSMRDDPETSSRLKKNIVHHLIAGGRCDRMVLGFTRCEFESRSVKVCSIQHYVKKFISGFLRVLPFPSPIKLTATI